MKVAIEKTGTLSRKIRVKISEEKVTQSIRARMEQLKREANIKGFRRNTKELASVLQERYGDSIRKEVISDLIEQSFRKVLKEKAFQAVGTPSIDDVKVQPGSDLEFIASFEVMPEFELKPFSNYSYQRFVAEVTDADVDFMQEQLRKRFSDFKTVDRAATIADRVVVDIETTVEGEAPEIQENAFLILEEQTVLPGLVDGFIGKQAKEHVSLNLVYPEEWANEKVAGKPLRIEATIREVSSRVLPDDAELSKRLQLSTKDTENLRANIRENLEKERDLAEFEASKEAILELILKDYEMELPKTLLEQERRSMEEEALRHNQTLDPKELDETVQQRVLLGLILNEIIKLKNLTVTPDQIYRQVARIAMNFPDPRTIIRAYYNNKDLMATVERSVLLDEAVREILKEANAIEKLVSYRDLTEGKVKATQQEENTVVAGTEA